MSPAPALLEATHHLCDKPAPCFWLAHAPPPPPPPTRASAPCRHRIRAASGRVSDHNVVGDGLTMGGAMVVAQGDGGVAWTHLETSLGLVPDPLEVLEAARGVAGAKATQQ